MVRQSQRKLQQIYIYTVAHKGTNTGGSDHKKKKYTFYYVSHLSVSRGLIKENNRIWSSIFT